MMEESLSPPSLETVLMHFGPVQASCVLGMLLILGAALFRSAAPSGRLFLTVMPLVFACVAGLRTLAEMSLLFPPDMIGGCSIGESFEKLMLHGTSEIRVLLLLGLIFSSLTFLAILLRNRRKTTAA